MQQARNRLYLINIYATMNDNKNNKNVSLEDMYKNLMHTQYSLNYDFSKWEKTGEVYKQFSIYDTSKYETILSSSTILNK